MRLGAVESDAPVAQVERGALLGSDLADAKVIGEIRPAAVGDEALGDQLQPAEGLLQESRGRHQQAEHADIDRL